MRAVVTGMIATYPLGGVAWDYGQYLVGLEKLGFEVYYLEDAGVPMYDPRRKTYDEDHAYGVAFLERTLARLSPDLATSWHFRAAGGRTFGMDPIAVEQLVRGADLFLNVSGSCLLRDEYMASRRKVLIDTDPGWNHFVNYPRAEAGELWPGTHSFRWHDYFFTYAERLGKPDCPLPSFGLTWHPTRPPVVLPCWHAESPGRQWTTVMTWDRFRKPVEHAGIIYGAKEREFGCVEALPREVAAGLEVAVGGDPPTDRWRSLGWTVIDSHGVSRTLDDYRHYIQSSRGEFSVAKNVYSATRCGWFSCRTVCYLAAGRPAIVQDTGFSESIPTGCGLLVFSDLQSAASAITAVEADYLVHQRAARTVAERYFASEVVLQDILNRAGLS